MTRGLFIVFEGLDGSGKTTQAKLLADRLSERGRRVHLTAEPTTGPIGAELRHYLAHRLSFDPRVLPYLFAADRADHLYNAESGILAALASGVTVICDRYVLSSLAYQSTEAARELVETLNRDFPPPDLTVYLDVTPEEGLAAKQRQSHLSEANDTLHKQAAVAREYARALDQLGSAHHVVRLRLLDRTPAETAAAILKAVEQLGA